jgi:hypothetical protein
MDRAQRNGSKLGQEKRDAARKLGKFLHAK